MRNIIWLISVMAALVLAQGDPHTMAGFVLNEGDSIPTTDCITFKVWVEGMPDTIYYPADYPTANYSEASGGFWIVQIADLGAGNGDTFIISFENICNGFVGSDTAVINSEPSQEIGTAYIFPPVGCGESRFKPAKFALSAAPSPFNSQCAIKIEGEGNISVEIFNVIGQSVEKLYNGISTGALTIKWQPESMRAGVYFIRASKNGEVHTRRIIYLP